MSDSSVDNRIRKPTWGWTLAILAAYGLAFGFQIVAIHGQSLSGDGAYHLIAGHQALRYGQNTVNFEHPPLAKLLVASPLLLEAEPLTAPLQVQEALATASSVFAQGEQLQRGTVRGRYVSLIVFIVPLLWACYALGRRFGGPKTGIVLSLMFALSLSVLPYLSVLQTDTAVALAFLLTLLLTMRYIERPDLRGAAWIGLASGFGLAVKFSAVLLGPTVLVGLLLAPLRWRRRLGHTAVIGFIVLATIEVSYLAANRDYSSELGREQISAYCEGRGTLTVDDRMLSAERPLLAAERIDPRLAQWLTGFWGVHLQNSIGVYPSYAFGEVRSAGRWWYFPAVLLIKTPIVILGVACLALIGLRGRWRPRQGARAPWILAGVTLSVYMVTAMTSNYNLSVRHMLPVLPLLYLPVAIFVAKRHLLATALISALVIESLAVAPLWMSQTNTWWLGSNNPTRFVLSAGNLEFRQNFIQLKRQADRLELEDLKVIYPGLAKEVLATYLPEARRVAFSDPPESGWYAVNVLIEQFVPAVLKANPEQVHNYDDLRRAAESWEPLWQAIRQGEDHGYIAGSFHLYRLP